MGVEWTVRAVMRPERLSPARLRAAVQDRLNTLVMQMSTWEPDSDISRFNRAPAGQRVVLPTDFYAVLHRSLEAAEESGGAFDPTLGPLVDLWGFGPAGPVDRPPSDGVIAEAARATGWARLELEATDRTALQPGGVRLDLSAAAKGYAVDEVGELLEQLGVGDYLVDIGGELRGAGVKPDGEPWWVEIETPPDRRRPAGPILVALHELSIATSGDYRRFLPFEGRRLGHTIDPATGRPLHTRVTSVTVLHRRCFEADLLCTQLYVLGEEAGLEHASRRGIAVLYGIEVGSGIEERMSPAFSEMLA